jgi:putative transposase
MKRARFTEDQIIGVLKEHEAGAKTADLARKHGVSEVGLSERRPCTIVDADRKMIRYRSCRPSDTELRTQLCDLANERKRFGYRRLRRTS